MSNLRPSKGSVAERGKWRFSHIETVKFLVLEGAQTNAEIGAKLGVSGDTVDGWRKRYHSFDTAITDAVSSMNRMALGLVAEDMKNGNVNTAKWWLERMAKAFKPEENKIVAGGDVTVQIVNYGADNNTTE